MKTNASAGPPGFSLLVSPRELKDSLGSGALIVDTRPFAEYSKSHIPGAVNIDLMQFHWIDTSSRGIREFNRQSKLLLSNIGVRRDRRVVFYDNNSGSSAARGVWLALYFSHRNVAMLDGGISDWKKKGYKTEKKTNPFQHSTFNGRPNPIILATYGDIEQALGDRNSILLDARSEEEYSGSVIRASRQGHIPHALSIDWVQNLDGSRFRDRRQLEHLYSMIPKDASVITYCQGGYRAANTFAVLKELGYKHVKMYLGSWGEWGNRRELPVEG